MVDAGSLTRICKVIAYSLIVGLSSIVDDISSCNSISNSGSRSVADSFVSEVTACGKQSSRVNIIVTSILCLSIRFLCNQQHV